MCGLFCALFSDRLIEDMDKERKNNAVLKEQLEYAGAQYRELMESQEAIKSNAREYTSEQVEKYIEM